jgi:branched-subunit amino acid transport protein AzlD
MNSLEEAFGLAFAMGAVILFCRAFPFLFFRKETADSSAEKPAKTAFLAFVEKIVPPVAMTVLAVNALGSSFRENPRDGFLVLAASVLTAALHLWKRNPLISILGGTALYMILSRWR